MSYRKIGNNKYRIEVERTIKGERYRKSEVLETKKKSSELKALVKSIEIKLYDQIAIEANDPNKLRDKTLVEFLEYYIQTKDLQQHTIDFYRSYGNLHFGTFFKNKRMQNISEKDIKEFFEYLKSYVSKRTGKPYSQKTIYHHRTVLNSLFNQAVVDGAIEKNPVNIQLAKPKRTLKKNFYEPEEIKYHLELLEKHGQPQYYLMYLLYVTTGMRPAEVSGLRWSKINFSTSEVLVDMSLTRTKTKGNIYKLTKTENSRTLSLTDYILALLKSHKSKERERCRDKKIPFTEDNYVFTTSRKEYLSTDVFQRYWKDFCKRYNIRYVSPYGLRHSAGTLLAINNIPLVNIAAQLGHTELKTTEIYLHASDTIKDRIKNVMESVTSPKLTLIK